jgi:hypothetical protein
MSKINGLEVFFRISQSNRFSSGSNKKKKKKRKFGNLERCTGPSNGQGYRKLGGGRDLCQCALDRRKHGEQYAPKRSMRLGESSKSRRSARRKGGMERKKDRLSDDTLTGLGIHRPVDGFYS